MDKTSLILLRGYPGSGKTTIGKQLESKGLGTFIDHNSLLTFIAKIAGNDEGIYNHIADLELAICNKLLKEGRSVIVARGFSKLQTIAPYENIARELGIDIIIIRLDVSSSELAKRVASPERKLDFNPTLDDIALKKWMDNNAIETHEEDIVINNERPLREVIYKIITVC